MTVALAPPPERLDAILSRHAIITSTLSHGADAETFVALSRELSGLDPVVAAIRAYRSAADNLSGLQALMDDPGTDAEMRALAELELVLVVCVGHGMRVAPTSDTTLEARRRAGR